LTGPAIITQAFEAVAASLAFGTVAYEFGSNSLLTVATKCVEPEALARTLDKCGMDPDAARREPFFDSDDRRPCHRRLVVHFAFGGGPLVAGAEHLVLALQLRASATGGFS
jgi:hypothetical protein